MENYQKTLSDGTSFSIPVDGAGVNVKTIAAATTLTGDDSGAVLVLSAATGAQIDLPVPLSGLKYKFIVGATFSTTSWTILATDQIIQGNVMCQGDLVAGANEDTISFVYTSGAVGDYVELVCDGTNWYVSGSGVATGSITLTQA